MSMSIPVRRLSGIPPERRPVVRAGGEGLPQVAPGQADPLSSVGPLKALTPLADFPSHLPLLEGFGIRDAAALRFWGAGGTRRMTVALVTGVPPVSLQNLARRLDLMRIPGLKADHARLLDDGGVNHPSDLARLAAPDGAAVEGRDRLLNALHARARQLSIWQNRSYEVPARDELARLAQAAIGIANSTD